MSRYVACINFVAHLDPRAPTSWSLGVRRVHGTLGAMDHFAQKRVEYNLRRDAFNERDRQWKEQYGLGSGDDCRAALASRWQQWAAKVVKEGGLTSMAARRVQIDDPHRKRKGKWWFCGGAPQCRPTCQWKRVTPI